MTRFNFQTIDDQAQIAEIAEDLDDVGGLGESAESDEDGECKLEDITNRSIYLEVNRPKYMGSKGWRYCD